jgi:hypothetical protein
MTEAAVAQPWQSAGLIRLKSTGVGDLNPWGLRDPEVPGSNPGGGTSNSQAPDNSFLNTLDFCYIKLNA